MACIYELIGGRNSYGFVVLWGIDILSRFDIESISDYVADYYQSDYWEEVADCACEALGGFCDCDHCETEDEIDWDCAGDLPIRDLLLWR